MDVRGEHCEDGLVQAAGVGVFFGAEFELDVAGEGLEVFWDIM